MIYRIGIFTVWDSRPGVWNFKNIIRKLGACIWFYLAGYTLIGALLFDETGADLSSRITGGLMVSGFVFFIGFIFWGMSWSTPEEHAELARRSKN